MIERLDLLLELFESPRSALKRFVYERPAGLSFCIFLLAVAGPHLAGGLFLRVGGEAAMIWLGPGLALRLLAASAVWFLSSAVYHFVCELMEGRGSSVSLLHLLAASLVPFLLAPAIVLIGMAVGNWFAILGWAAVVLWALRLQVMSLEVLYGFGAGRALIAYLVPPAAAFALLFAAFIITVGGLAAWAAMGG